MKDTSIMCPSSVCKPGAQILGVRQNDGKVAMLPQPMAIDQAFIEKVKDRPIAAEQRFRFTNKCVELGCGQWNGKGCGLADELIAEISKIPGLVDLAELPACGIRSRCRWYLQRQAEACKVCPYVIYQVTEQDVLLMQIEEH